MYQTIIYLKKVKKMLRLTKKEETEAITKISIDALHTDYLVGLDPND